MNNLPQNPPSYESVIASSTDQIGAVTMTQPVYPVLPSAPPMQMPMPQPIQNYGSINEAIQAQPSVNQPIVSDVTVIVGVNGCPICRIGVLEDDYSCFGICLAIFCFPLGILCCLACKNKRCSSCGAII
ncbi:unnamed protein product [Chironomus riparius]|uniref:Membrane protein BRI3 n=1 Tax=Chironomus riparius TaxID=315576 RepID=A0A9P0NP60_9DIPT|nr:unnamed protein product [Chironomus riparius]